jgi:hypothetical protein
VVFSERGFKGQLTVDVPLVWSDLARPRPLVEERAIGVVVGTAIPDDRAGRDSADQSEKSSGRDHLCRM